MGPKMKKGAPKRSRRYKKMSSIGKITGTVCRLTHNDGIKRQSLKSGSVSDALVSQMDLFASLASLLGQDVPEGLDSKSMPEVFFGGSNEGRESLVLGSDGKLTFRLGKLHLIPPYPGYAVDPTGTETGYSDDWALYDLAADSTEHVRVR